MVSEEQLLALLADKNPAAPAPEQKKEPALLVPKREKEPKLPGLLREEIKDKS